jgi:hypothetical protein
VTYWDRLGEWLGPYREAWACVILDIVAKTPSGTQLTRFNWHRGNVARVRLVVDEIDITPTNGVDVAERPA